MKKNHDQSADTAELRRRAEERLGEKSEAGDPGTAEDAARLVHELQVHQIELEMQNEELQQAHTQVETLLAQYTDLYDFAPAGYLTLDREGAIRQVNLTGARLLGVERSRLVNRRFGLFGADGDRRTFSDFLEKVFASQAKESCEVTLLHESSQPLVVQIEGMRSADGQECRAVVLDITERRKLEEQFRQIQKMEAVGQLAAGVAHDFNNMLAVIQLQASLLKAEEGLSSQQLESASEIEKATERAANLTRQLLLFSRKQTMQPRDLDLNQSINDMTKMLRRTLGEAIQMQFKFAMEPLLIHADAGMLDQVLMNLAVNAHDAMPKGGQLVIETSAVEFDESVCAQSPLARPGSFVCLSVGDTGCGIPPENLPRIFEPFFTTKDVGKGTGLGLATVFGIVQQHQGWINVYSEVGRGTIFRVYLPRLDVKSGQESGQPELTAVRGGKETILLVEDEGALRSSMRKALLQLGYHVLESVSGGEAQKVWEQHRNRIDLLVTDMVMPGGVTGKDLAERLLHENPKLKVIYNSGYSVELAGRDFPLEEGVNFLPKPFGADKLAQTVRDKLDAITEHTQKETAP